MKGTVTLVGMVLICSLFANAEDHVKTEFVGDITIRAVPAMKAVTVNVKAADYVPKHGWARGVDGLQQAYAAMLRNGYEKLARWMKEGGHPAGPSFVIFQQNPATAAPGDLTCKIGYPVGVKAKDKHVAVIENLPSMLAAVVRYQGTFDDHVALRDSLEKWIAARGFAPDGPLMEVYLKGTRSSADSDDVAEIRWPVRRLDTSTDTNSSSSR